MKKRPTLVDLPSSKLALCTTAVAGVMQAIGQALWGTPYQDVPLLPFVFILCIYAAWVATPRPRKGLEVMAAFGLIFTGATGGAHTANKAAHAFASAPPAVLAQVVQTNRPPVIVWGSLELASSKEVSPCVFRSL